MIRIFNIALLASLIGSAVWAYSIKYETIYYAEILKKLDNEIEREREAITVARAEYQLLSKPSRIQMLADRHLTLKPFTAMQVISAGDLPATDPGIDLLGAKLDSLLGSTGSIPTPDQGRKSSGKTPGSE
jgi:hypothetical protein